jgi:tetratricopeptide (TPR) repeat protein
MADDTRRQQIEEMLREDPGDAFLRYALALEHASAGDTPAAVAELRRLLEVTPEYVPAYLQLGQLLLRLDDVVAARECLRKGVTVARLAGDTHAAEEMQALLAGL